MATKTNSKKRGFQLQERDIDILRWIFYLRFSTAKQLEKAVERSWLTLQTRLLRLSEHGYVYRKKYLLKETLPLKNQPYVYTLDREAVLLLAEQEIGEKKKLDLMVLGGRRVKPMFMRHALMLTDIHVSLALASRTSPIKLIDWWEGKDIQERVEFVEYDKGNRRKELKLPVSPDAIFVLEDSRREHGKNRAYVFLEADRSTENHEKFLSKIKAYNAYFAQGKHTQRYGIKSARVVTVTRSRERASNLCRASGEVLPNDQRRFYYFAPMSEFSWRDTDAERIFEGIFISPSNMDRTYHLVPPLDK